MYILFSTLFLVFSLFVGLAYAEPAILTDKQFDAYQFKIDKTIAEKLAPAKQLDLGILQHDIICFDEKITILKLAAEFFIACVDPNTADTLVERNWGIVHKESQTEGSGGSECIIYWTVYHNDDVSSNTLIKSLRETTSKFANDRVVWSPLEILEHNKQSTNISQHGLFSTEQIQTITENIESLEGVINLEHKTGPCL